MSAATAYEWGLGAIATGLTSGLLYVHIDGEIVAISSTDPMAIRAAWMRMRDVPEEEIADMCNSIAYPGAIAEELENLRAAQELEANKLTSESLEAFAAKYHPPTDW